ncbi:MAG: hypothetical protein LBT23_09855, partial [Synergistaceae bacterium]|nr:hypothetical protein [Synergistaceae bacterium]
MGILILILAAAVRSGTPVLYSVMGEILTERSGVMNLGLEGVILIGVFAGFSATQSTGDPVNRRPSDADAGCGNENTRAPSSHAAVSH